MAALGFLIFLLRSAFLRTSRFWNIVMTIGDDRVEEGRLHCTYFAARGINIFICAWDFRLNRGGAGVWRFWRTGRGTRVNSWSLALLGLDRIVLGAAVGVVKRYACQR